jgi:ABC-type nitrate/sulfonate/bicarbonate transport system substrate-binding protein
MKHMTRTTAALLLLATLARAVPELTVAYRSDDHAAPLFDACLYAKDFRARYGLHLKEVKPQAQYSLLDGKRQTLSLRPASYTSDTAVLSALLSGDAQVVILSSEAMLAAVLLGRKVKIIAPLQHGSDLLVVDPSVPAANWEEFAAWVKERDRVTTVGYLGKYSMAALGLTQALEHENVNYAGTVPGRGLCAKPESAKVKLFRADDRAALAAELSSGRFDAAVLEEPVAAWLNALRNCRTIDRTDTVPPGRFENHPGTVIAATVSTIRDRGEDLSQFLELAAVATHYADSHPENAHAAVCQWLGTSPQQESVALGNMRFSSTPDAAFTGGIWNWYLALRERRAVPRNLAGYRQEKDWLGVPYDSLLLKPALERASKRITR